LNAAIVLVIVLRFAIVLDCTILLNRFKLLKLLDAFYENLSKCIALVVGLHRLFEVLYDFFVEEVRIVIQFLLNS